MFNFYLILISKIVRADSENRTHIFWLEARNNYSIILYPLIGIGGAEQNRTVIFRVQAEGNRRYTTAPLKRNLHWATSLGIDLPPKTNLQVSL